MSSAFYESLAQYYHLIFEDWDRSIVRQREIIARVLTPDLGRGPWNVLDCACGIGTQAIGFAQSGHHVVASDVSPAALDRARREAARRSLHIDFHLSDMTSLSGISEARFDLVAAMDNALPHLEAGALRQAAHSMASKLRPAGIFLASIRDYDRLVVDRPTIQPPAFYSNGQGRWFVHQIWDWQDESHYAMHLYITENLTGPWVSHHFLGQYRCLSRNELTETLHAAGLERVRWLMPEDSGFYQPIVLAQRPGAPSTR